MPKTGLPGLIAGSKLLTGSDSTLLVYDLPSAEPIGEPLKWVRRGCTGTRASVNLLTTRYRGTSGWIDLDSREITPFLGIRPGCSVNNNLYPANGVLNMPNLTAGCTCNYAPVSAACVPARAIQRDDMPSGAAAVEAPNLLPNSGSELDENHDGRPDGWSFARELTHTVLTKTAQGTEPGKQLEVYLKQQLCEHVDRRLKAYEALKSRADCAQWQKQR